MPTHNHHFIQPLFMICLGSSFFPLSLQKNLLSIHPLIYQYLWLSVHSFIILLICLCIQTTTKRFSPLGRNSTKSWLFSCEWNSIILSVFKFDVVEGDRYRLSKLSSEITNRINKQFHENIERDSSPLVKAKQTGPEWVFNESKTKQTKATVLTLRNEGY